MPDEVTGAERSESPVRRAPYATPALTVYGTVAELTRKVGKTANKDGGTFPKNRSSP